MEDCAPDWFRRDSSPVPPVLTSDTDVYEGDHLKAIIRRERYKRQRRFHFEDHKYVLRFVKKMPNEKDPSLVSSMDVIQNGIAGVLQRLQDYYTARRTSAAPSSLQTRMRRKYSHQAFICVQSDAVNRKRGAITMGSFSIEEENPEQIANMLCLKMYRQFSNYEKTVSIDEKFLVHFRVVGGPLLAFKSLSKRGFTMDRERVKIRGHKIEPIPAVVEGQARQTRPGFVLPTPEGFTGHDVALKGECVLTSLVLARARCRVLFSFARDKHKLSENTKLVNDYLNCPRNGLSINAGLFIVKEVNFLQKIHGHLSNVEEIVSAVARQWRMQIVVYDINANLVGLYPEDLELSWPFVFMLLTRNDSGVGHLELLTNFPVFCRQIGFSCFFPHCNYRSKYFARQRHNCRTSMAEISSCFNCRKFVATPGVKILLDADTKKYLFCQAKGKKKITCKKCNMVITSKSCYNDHIKICYILGFLCLKCNKYVHGAQNLVKKSHRCGIEICIRCFQPLSESETHAEPVDIAEVILKDPTSEHLCSFTKVKLRTEIPNLGFAQLQTATVGNANCITCFKLEERHPREKCCYHKVMDTEESDCDTLPAVCTLIYESKMHEKFSIASFVTPSICDERPKIHLPHFASYIPLEVRQMLPNLELSRKERRAQFNHIPKRDESFEKAVHELAKKSEVDALDLFLRYVLQEKFRNFVILLETYDQLDTIMLGLILNNIKPKSVLKRKGNTMRFKVSTFDITFACSKCYVDQEVWQALEDEDSLSFFPLSLLKWEHWQSIQEIPPLECFLELQDKKKLRQLKRAYWEKHRGKKWDPINELIGSSSSTLFAFVNMMLTYIKCCLEFQVKLTIAKIVQD